MKSKAITGADAAFQETFQAVYDAAKHVPNLLGEVSDLRRAQIRLVGEYLDATRKNTTAKAVAFEAAAALIPAMANHSYCDPADTAAHMSGLTTAMLRYADTPALKELAKKTAAASLPDVIRLDRAQARLILVALAGKDENAPTPAVIGASFMSVTTDGGDTAWLLKSTAQGNRKHKKPVTTVDVFTAYASGELKQVLLQSPETSASQTRLSAHAETFRHVAEGKLTPAQAAIQILNQDGTRYSTLDA